MLRKYSNSRTLGDNVRLGILTALVAGMVNVASLLLFLSFSSNVTGYFAILASELVNGNIYQIALVGSWIFLFFFGSFVSNFLVINLSEKKISTWRMRFPVAGIGLYFSGRCLWNVWIQGFITGVGADAVTIVICHGFTERTYGEYFQLCGKNNPPYGSYYRSGGAGIHVHQ